MKMWIDNLKGTGDFRFMVEHKGRTVSLVLSSIINRENKGRVGGMDSIRQFEPILVYLQKRGLEDKFFEIYESIHERFIPSIGAGKTNVCREITMELMAILDYKDIVKFVVTDLGREPLSSLPDTFNESILKTGFGAKGQTYLKSDYIELCALITMFKVILPPLTHYQYLKGNTSSDKAASDAFDYLEDTPLMTLPPMEKLKGLVTVIKSRKPQGDIQVTLSTNISTDSRIDMLVAVMCFTKLFTASFLEDTNDRQIIKVLHGKVGKMIDPKQNAVKIGLETKVNGNDANAPSVMENIRVGTSLSLGDVEEFNFIFTNKEYLQNIFKFLGMTLDDKKFVRIYKLTEVYESIEPTEVSNTVCGWLFDTKIGLINVGALEHLRADANRVRITIAALYFIERKEYMYAMLVSAYKHNSFSNSNEDKSTLRSEVAGELGETMYGENQARSNINALSKKVMVHLYVQIVPDKFLYKDRVTSLPRSIRNDLSILFIEMYKKEKK